MSYCPWHIEMIHQSFYSDENVKKNPAEFQPLYSYAI